MFKPGMTVKVIKPALRNIDPRYIYYVGTIGFIEKIEGEFVYVIPEEGRPLWYYKDEIEYYPS